MIRRLITDELLEAAGEYPVVTIFGPRQCGKTTLVRMTFPGMAYTSLENPDIRAAAQQDPRGFLNEFPQGAVVDEVQRFPELLSYIQSSVDETNRPGMFILTGSHQPELHQSVSQTLAGRTAVLTLSTFSLAELTEYQTGWDPFDLIARGTYPRVHQEQLQPGRFFNGHVQTYLERDVRSLINIPDLRPFQQFVTLLAGRIGQVVNWTSLSNDVGVSATTIKTWVSVLKASFIVYELPPFFENIKKRVVKSPKLYFCDPGLAAFLLGIHDAPQVSRDPLRGGLYENLWIMEMAKHFYNRGSRPELFFYRDSHGNEVDLVLRRGRTLVPIEIKSAATFTPAFLTGINRFAKAAAKRSSGGFVLYNGPHALQVGGVRILNPLVHDGLATIAGVT